MSDAINFANGEPCDMHGIGFCADCQKRLGLRRGNGHTEEAAGFFFDNDCAVASFRELTGAGYDEAVEALGDGFNPRSGTDPGALAEAFNRVGYGLRLATHLGIEGARIASISGQRSFLVAGSSRREGGHAWTITEGRVNRDVLTGRRYIQIFEIIP